MILNLVRYIPSEVRLEMAQELIAEMGIRPLAREIGVNPKSVYKYKEGTAHPGNEVMSKILAVMNRRDPDLVDDYLERIREEFLEALQGPIKSQELLDSVKEAETSIAEPAFVREEGGVGQRPTHPSEEEGPVGQEETESLSLEDIYVRMGVTSPFNQKKVQKILHALEGSSGLDLSELADRTGISDEALERYLDGMIEEEVIIQEASGEFELSVELERGE